MPGPYRVPVQLVQRGETKPVQERQHVRLLRSAYQAECFLHVLWGCRELDGESRVQGTSSQSFGDRIGGSHI
jgi:hypothetical protein